MFCKNCGEVLVDTDVYCLNCGFAAGDGIRFCAFCGSEVLPGSIVCEICGSPVDSLPDDPGAFQYQQAPPPYPQQKHHMPYGMPYPQNDPMMQQGFDPTQMPQQMQGAFGQFAPFGMNGQPYANGYPYKSRICAGLLGIFLGFFGVHNFYLNRTAPAVAQLLMTICSCGVLGIASWIWGIIEGIMLLNGGIDRDGNGLPLK